MSWVLILAGVLVAWLVFTFNKLVRFRNQSRNAWADIDVQLKRRYDLIPNLVAGLFGFTLGDFFKIEAAERVAPRVDLDSE